MMERLYEFDQLIVLTDNTNVFWYNQALNREEIRDNPYALVLIIRGQIMRYKGDTE